MKKYSVVIIGGGPSGLSASIYNARAGMNPLVIAGSPPGGQLMLTSGVENYPGFISIHGPMLIENMREHAKKFGACLLDINVKSIDTKTNVFKVLLEGGDIIEARAILIATGASAKWLNLASEKRLIGKGVSACATCDGFFFRNKVVGVVGGGDVAMEEVLTLTRFAQKVYLIHRRDSFRASKIMQERVLKNKKVQILYNTEVVEVLGKERVEGVRLGGKNPTEAKIDLTGLFVSIGHTPNSKFLNGSGVAVDDKGYIDIAGWSVWKKSCGLKTTDIKGHYYYQTSVPGIFASGDVVDYTFRQAATAVGMGVGASLEIERFLEENNDHTHK